MLDVPFCIADATALTEAGYVGEDVETILLRLIQAADHDLERAATGIVYIDEIDKITRKSGANPSITRDVSGEGVQQALLKIIEGTVAKVPVQDGRKHPLGEQVEVAEVRHSWELGKQRTAIFPLDRLGGEVGNNGGAEPTTEQRDNLQIWRRCHNPGALGAAAAKGKEASGGASFLTAVLFAGKLSLPRRSACS